MGGVLPFGCIFIQLFFVLNSIWSSQIYYMYGFLFLVFIILLITCSETTILLCYFHLCAEVRKWLTKYHLFATRVHLEIALFHHFLGNFSSNKDNLRLTSSLKSVKSQLFLLILFFCAKFPLENFWGEVFKNFASTLRKTSDVENLVYWIGIFKLRFLEHVRLHLIDRCQYFRITIGGGEASWHPDSPHSTWQCTAYTTL